MATAENVSKQTGLGWVTKLTLWAVVIAFGYLYLSSLDREVTTVASSSSTDAGAATLAAPAEESSGLDRVLEQVGGFADSAEVFIGEAISAGSAGVDFVVSKVQEWTGSAPAADAPPAVEPALAVPSEPAVAASAEAAVAAPPAAAPQTPGFERHYAPLPMAHGTAQPSGVAPEVSSAPKTPAPIPVTEAEATVFAETLMRQEQGVAPAGSVVGGAAPVATEAAPPVDLAMPAAPPALPPAAPLYPTQGPYAQQRAQMQADHEAMQRAAEQRAREYWQQQPAQLPPRGGVYPGYVPGYGGPAYAPTPGYAPAPGYAPGYGQGAYPYPPMR